MGENQLIWPEDAPLTLVVPIHGQIDTTLKFLESYNRQSVQVPLIFVDDRSPDDSVSILRKRGCTVYVPDERLWFNGALRMAIQECRTPLCGVLNNDLLLGRDFTKEMLAAFEESKYDVLVPKTVDLPEYEYLDVTREYKITDLMRQEGWCLLFRTEAIGRLPRIPDEFKLWFGDTWIYHYAWKFGLKTGKAEHVRVFHAESLTLKATGMAASRQIHMEEEHQRDQYRWIKPYRRPWDLPEAEKEKRYSIDPASKKLLQVDTVNFEDDEKERHNICVGKGWPQLDRIEPTKDLGHVVAVVPVSKLHLRFKERFEKTIQSAWEYSHGPFRSFHVEYVVDEEQRGAGWGRNLGIERNPDADWYFFLDVDDLPKPFCFEAMNHATEDIVWGVIEHRVIREKKVVMVIHEQTFDNYDWQELILFGHRSGAGFNNAFFIRGEIARKNRWFEKAYVFEDIEYFIVSAAHGSIEKLPFPLVTIDKTISKPYDGGVRYTPDKEAVWFPIQTFWLNHGQNPLPDDYRKWRNEAKTMAEFYK